MTAYRGREQWPQGIVAAGYDRIAERYALWAERDCLDEARPRYAELLVASLPGGASVLELGCGGGSSTTRLLADRFELTGIDISSRQVELARERVPRAVFIQGDMTRAEFSPGSFDGIASFYALTHVPAPDLPLLLEKIGLWLRLGGIFVASMSTTSDPGSIEDDWLGVPMFFSGHEIDENKRLVQEAGLEISVAQEETIRENGRPVTFLWVVAHKSR